MAVFISATSDALFRRSLPMIHPKFRSSFLTRVDLSQARWLRLARPSLFFALTIYYEELFLKLYCFRAIPPTGALFTLLFTIPVALLLGLLCGGVSLRRGRVLLPLCTGLVSLWLGAQAIYYRLFKTFLTIFP